MAFDIAATIAAVKTHLDDSDLFQTVHVGRPESPVGDGPVATIHGESMEVVGVTNHAIELHVLGIRIFQATHSDALETLETDGWSLVSQVMDLFYGDFELGGRIRNVDIGGQYGAPPSVERDQDDIDTSPFYVAEITLPLIVDSATTLVA